MNDYRVAAVLSALFAGLTAVLAKKGVEGVPGNLALAIRVTVVVLFAWVLVLVSRETDLRAVPRAAWAWLALSGVGTGLSWLFYFRALKGGPVSVVAPIDKLSFVIAVALGLLILRERPSSNVLIGAAVVALGVGIALRG